MTTKAMTRKRLTVDVIERRQICFRLGQDAVDRATDRLGMIVAITSKGCFLRRRISKEGCWHIERWFSKHKDLRPCRDGRRYV